MSELKPCPFCGGEAEIREGGSWCSWDPDEFWGECKECHCNIGVEATKWDAAAAWNKRVGEDK